MIKCLNNRRYQFRKRAIAVPIVRYGWFVWGAVFPARYAVMAVVAELVIFKRRGDAGRPVEVL